MPRGLAIARAVLALGVVAAMAGDAAANGRFPGTSSISFRQGNEQDIAVGLTFGLALSHDGGRTWAWMCEDTVGYTGTYDPDYAYSASGAVFATTYDGLKVMRDGCTFEAMPSGRTFSSANTLGPDGAVYYAAAQIEDTPKQLAADFRVYRSTDDGRTFPVVAKPGDAGDVNDWWSSLVVAPSNAMRLYVSGYSYMAAQPGGEMRRTHLAFRSTDGGASWQEMTTVGLTLMPNSSIEIVGVDPDVADHLYARVKLDDNTLSDSLYRSTTAGASWTQIKRVHGSITSFVVRRAKNAQDRHDLIYGTQTLGAEVSHDDGDSWTPLVDPPHMNCLVENAAGELWACTQNKEYRQVMSDDAGVMKTTDLVTWTKVLRYQDLTEAVRCAAGTIQQDTCVPLWCAVCTQLECTPSASYGCAQPVDAPPPPQGKSGGCCDAGGGGGLAALAFGAAVGTVVLRPRRRRVSP